MKALIHLFIFLSLILVLNAEVIVSEVIAEDCSLRYFTACVYDSNGVNIQDLDLEDFEFELNGHPLESSNIHILNDCISDSVKLDIVFFLDFSGSMDPYVELLRSHTRDFVSGIAGTNYRVAIVLFAGCREQGILSLFRTTFGTSCIYSESAPDYWASSITEFECLFNAGYNHFYNYLSGSSMEDQYGAMAYYAQNEIEFRHDARKVFCLLTDEVPNYSERCAPSYGSSDEDLERFTALMLQNDIEVITVTPSSTTIDYPAYFGYERLSEATNGIWIDLFTDEFAVLVSEITNALDYCCFEFSYIESDFCTDTNFLEISVLDYGIDTTSYLTSCPLAECMDSPDPFTPNGDIYNPYVVFSYPNIDKEDAELLIFTRRKVLVYNSKIFKVSNWQEVYNKRWDGKDNKGKDMPPGLYFYIIKQDGKVICDGTITLVR